MSALVSLVGICASGEAFALRRKRRKKEAESRSDGDDTIQKHSRYVGQRLAVRIDVRTHVHTYIRLGKL